MSETLKLKATNMKLTKSNGNTSTKAYGTITFNDTIKINGVNIVEAKDGNLFVSWPARKIDNKWIPYISFAEEKKEWRNKLSEWILKQYSDGNVVDYSKQNTATQSSQPTNEDDDDLPF